MNTFADIFHIPPTRRPDDIQRLDTRGYGASQVRLPGSAGVSPAYASHLAHPRSTSHTLRPGEIPQSITFRLHDSIPANLRAEWEAELNHLSKSEQQLERRTRIEAALNRGYGACYLRNP